MVTAQWDQYFAQWEGKPGSMLVNMDLYDSSLQPSHPFLLAVGLAFQECTADGMPDSSTYQELVAISDKLEAYIDIQHESIIVGTFTHDCKRIDYYYTADSTGIREFVTQFFNNNATDYTPLIALSSDPEWSYYHDVIYPDAFLMEYMMNQRLIEDMARRGDDLGKSRRIHHWAYFDNIEDRGKFRLVVLERGFKEESVGQLNSSDKPYYYHFSRRDKPELQYISELTHKLQEEAQSLRGLYDGWECELVPKKNP